jgi:glycosyltransferase involved in cell wall biosynthesis
LLVDGGSNDRTLEIAKRYPVRIIHNSKRTCPAGRYLGFLNATGDLHTYIDADMELCEKTWLEDMVRPLAENPKVTASFPEYRVDPKDPPLTRYFQHHQVWNPYLEFISPTVRETIESSSPNYSLCHFKPDRFPLVPIMLFRMEILRKLLESKGPGWGWIDTEIAVLSVNRNFRTFAYVPVGLYHHTYPSLRVYCRKIKRDVQESYMRTLGEREVVYVDRHNPADLVSLASWILYANSLIPETFRALINTIAYREWVMLYRPIVSAVGTDLPILFAFNNASSLKEYVQKT